MRRGIGWQSNDVYGVLVAHVQSQVVWQGQGGRRRGMNEPPGRATAGMHNWLCS